MIDLYELAIARKLSGGGGGGGGSSDFSTAKLWLVTTGSSPDGGGGANINAINNDRIIPVDDFDSFLSACPLDVVLYKGHAIGTANAENMSVSGDATWDSDTGSIDIFGECTITYVGFGLI